MGWQWLTHRLRTVPAHCEADRANSQSSYGISSLFSGHSSPTDATPSGSDPVAVDTPSNSPPPGLTTQKPSADPLTPVPFEQFGKEFTQLSSLDTFDGFRLEAGKTVTPQMQANHTLFLGTSLRETGYTYQFGPTFALDDGSMFLMARYGNDGVMTARGMRKLTPTIETRISASSSLESEQRSMLELAADKTGRDWVLGTKLAWQGTWIADATFSQLIAPNLSLGGNYTWISATGATTGSVGLRYAFGSNVVSCLVTRQPNFKSMTGLTENVHSTKVQYFRKVSDRLSLGTELELAQEPPKRESALRLGYEYLFRQARIQGFIDFGGRIAMTAQNTAGFGVSGTIDYKKGDYKFGFMMQIVPPPSSTPGSDTPSVGLA